MENRDFKGVWIPKEVWLDESLSITEKCLLVEINSLDNGEKGCFASNESLGKFLGLSGSRIANMCNDLKKRGFLIQCYYDGRTRGLRFTENGRPALPKTVDQLYRKRESSFTENGNIVIHSNNKDENNVDTIVSTWGELYNTLEEKEKNKIFEFLNSVNLLHFNNIFEQFYSNFKKLGSNTPDTAFKLASEAIVLLSQNKGLKTPKNDKVEVFPFQETLISLGVEKQIAHDYIDLRKRKRAGLSRTALAGIYNECKKNNLTINEAIKTCVEQNWQTFKYSWYQNINQTQKQQKQQKNDNYARKTGHDLDQLFRIMQS